MQRFSRLILILLSVKLVACTGSSESPVVQPPLVPDISVSGSYEEGGTLTIQSNKSDIHFGGAPTILYRETGMGLSAGSTVRTVPEAGIGSVSSNNIGLPIVEDVPELPYRRRIVFGTESMAANSVQYRMAAVVAPEIYSEFFEQQYIYWPASHQQNAMTILNAQEDAGVAATWQSKPLWNMYTRDGYSGYTLPGAMDIFTGFLLWYSPTRKWTSGYVIQANATPVSTTFRSGNGLLVEGQPVNNPVLSQTWIKAGPVAGSSDGSDGSYYVADTVDGALAEYNLAGKTFTSSVASMIGWDRFNYPGYVRGFPREGQAHFYYGDLYKAIGPNSRARVEIVDSAVYAERKKSTLADVTNWSNQQVVVKVRKGIFYNENLTGKYLFLFKGDGEAISLGQIQ